MSQQLVNWSPTLSYLTIIGRDFATTFIMMFFLIKVNLRERTIKAQLEKDETLMDLLELNSVLNSVAPMYSFSKYLDTHKPDYRNLLKLVKLHRQF